MLFQPPSGEYDPWLLSEYRHAETLIWVAAILGLVFGILLLADYLNNRKFNHFLWSGSFSVIWIVFHQVITGGDFSVLVSAMMAGLSALISGFMAAGLVASVLDEKKGKLYALFVLVMAVVITIFKFLTTTLILIYVMMSNFMMVAFISMIGSILVMILHIPSGLLIIYLPIKAYKANEVPKAAVLLSIGGLLMSVVGMLLTLISLSIVATDAFIAVAFNLFPIVLLAAVICFALGTLIPEKWNFSIPGIEFED